MAVFLSGGNPSEGFRLAETQGKTGQALSGFGGQTRTLCLPEHHRGYRRLSRPEQHGKEYYVKEIAGLCINPSENKWYSHYAGIGRINNSIDCLTQMCGMNFNQAVYALTGTDISTTRSYDYPKEQQPQYTSPTMNFEKEKKRKELDVPPPCDILKALAISNKK